MRFFFSLFWFLSFCLLFLSIISSKSSNFAFKRHAYGVLLSLSGKTVPLYAMPHVCVRAFHSGGPAFDINFGKMKYWVLHHTLKVQRQLWLSVFETVCEDRIQCRVLLSMHYVDCCNDLC